MSAPTGQAEGPGGTPRRRTSGSERRAEIVAAARRLFSRRGFDATTTREIAAAAGVSDALIYRHFTGKDDLLRAVVDDGIAQFSRLGPAAGVAPHGLPLEHLLTGIGRAFLTALHDQLDLITLLIAQQHIVGADTRFVEFIDTAARQLGALIDHRLPDSSFDARAAPDGTDRGYLLARAFMGSLVAFVVLQQRLGLDRIRRVDHEAYLRTTVGALVAGLHAEPVTERADP